VSKNIITTPAEHNAYFRSLAKRHPSIKDFVYGDSERILSMDRSTLKYPVLWLETPRSNWKLKEPAQASFTGAFVVLINTPIDDDQREEYVIDYAWQITRDLINMIREDARLDFIEAVIGSFSSDPILGYGTDNDFGWRTNYQLETPIGNCPAVCTPPNACPAGSLARFKWENRNVGDFTNLVITSDNKPEGMELEWDEVRYDVYRDNGPVSSFQDTVDNNIGQGAHLRIVMTITKGDCKLVASAYFTNETGCGTSVPFLLRHDQFI
jgi:hypothetical protein